MATNSIKCYYGAYAPINEKSASYLRTQIEDPNGVYRVTLAANQYPYRITMDTSGAIVNQHPKQKIDREAWLYLGHSLNTSTSILLGHWETYNGDDTGTTAGGVPYDVTNRYFIYNGVDKTFSNGRSLAGKTLSIYLDGDGTGGTSFQGIANVEVFFNTLYSVTPSQTTGGTIKINNGTDAVYMLPGEQVTLSATPASGYEFVRWNVSPSATISGNTLTVPSSNVTVSATFQLIHTLKWTTPNSLTVTQNDYKLTAKLTGSATDTWSHTITYKLYGYNGAGQTIFNETFGAASTVQIPITDANIGVQYTFKAFAVCSANSAEGPSFTITPKNVHKTVQYRVNGQWVECIPYYRINDTWQEVEPYYQKDGVWIPCSKT